MRIEIIKCDCCNRNMNIATVNVTLQMGSATRRDLEFCPECGDRAVKLLGFHHDCNAILSTAQGAWGGRGPVGGGRRFPDEPAAGAMQKLKEIKI